MMPRIQAWELLNNLDYSRKLSMSELYDLLVEAGYTEDQAQCAANKRGWDRLSLGMTM